ncbi:MAG TPA: type IV toxin-antitoxin system AbiEi family antitoxin domain-containing protein [Acidimicrobiales bacterium]|nr:type IV toxin-antitoxin system AbiEi family antitoxin domain-containing protein [Acidimicrobiales bacterium]
MTGIDRSIRSVTAAQLGLITTRQALSIGLSRRQIAWRVREGVWVRYHPGVFGVAGVGPSARTDLLAACLAAGPPAAASHLSAAWILGLTRRPPSRPCITVPYDMRPRLERVEVHRSRDLDPDRVLYRRGVPYTDALRCICDLAAGMERDALDPIVDRAVATGMVTIGGLLAEIQRLSRRGRQGPRTLARVLEVRALAGGPPPSVLEAEAMRLFHRFGITIQGREVHMGSEGRYRIDFLIRPGLVAEVDGFAHHWSPEHKAYDDARRNALLMDGVLVLVYNWRDVFFDGARVVRDIRAAQRAA